MSWVTLVVISEQERKEIIRIIGNHGYWIVTETWEAGYEDTEGYQTFPSLEIEALDRDAKPQCARWFDFSIRDNRVYFDHLPAGTPDQIIEGLGLLRRLAEDIERCLSTRPRRLEHLE